MQAILEVTAGPHAGRKIVLLPGVPVSIGRTSKSDYVVAEDTFLSSAHFNVEYSPDRSVVRDLGSSNGTFLNGARTGESALRDGDIITAGQSSFTVRLETLVERPDQPTAFSMDDTRPMPMQLFETSVSPAVSPASWPPPPPAPLTPPPPPSNAPSPPPPPVSPAPPPPMPTGTLKPALTVAQRGLLDVLRGLENPVFAVLDGAAASELIASMRSAGEPVEALSGASGPCIVGVNPDSLFAQKLAVEGWGNSWGIFVTSHQSLQIVRNHLRRFQTLLTQDGAEFEFRLFNPVLLRAFLPTLSGSEAKSFFGPIAGILTEGGTPDKLMLFMPGSVRTLQKMIALTGPVSEG